LKSWSKYRKNLDVLPATASGMPIRAAVFCASARSSRSIMIVVLSLIAILVSPVFLLWLIVLRFTSFFGVIDV
jgi:hypothetical protein